MFWYYMIPGTFVGYFLLMWIFIAFCKKIGTYDE